MTTLAFSRCISIANLFGLPRVDELLNAKRLLASTRSCAPEAHASQPTISPPRQDEFHDRGLCYMFCNLAPSTNRPILLALLAGEAAQYAEERSDESLVASAMLALRRAFPLVCHPLGPHASRCST